MIFVNLLSTNISCTSPCCRRNAIPGMKQCLKHYRVGRANGIKHVAVLRAKRAALGLCRQCDQPKLVDSIFCEPHRKRSRESVARFRGTEYGQEVNKNCTISEHLKRKADRRCTACGKPSKIDALKCQRCVDADARNNVERKQQRVAGGLCIYCGEVSTTGRTGRQRSSCDACRLRRKGFDRTYSSRLSRARSGSTARKLGWSLTLEEYIEIVEQPCAYCQLDNDTDQGVGLDRLDNKKGYHGNNVVSCCPECNMVRNTIFTPEEMKILGQAVRQIKLARIAAKGNN